MLTAHRSIRLRLGPFALCVHYKGPHHFYEYPERHAKLLEGVTIPEPPTLHEDVVATSPRLKAELPQQMTRNKAYYDHLCSNVDFAPTLLDYAGVAVPPAMQGRSMRPLLRGESPAEWRKAIWYSYWGAPPNHWVIRTADSTLIRFPGTDEFEFYDLARDPLQTRSVHADPGYAERIAETRKLLAKTIQEVDIQALEFPGTRKQDDGNAKTKTKTKTKKKKQP